MKPYSLGAPLEGGFLGGRVRVGRQASMVIWAPKEVGQTIGPWLETNTVIPGANSCSDSIANTVAMVKAGSPIAIWAAGLDIAGYRDWCVPARDVLELAYRNMKPNANGASISPREGENPSSLPPGYSYSERAPRMTNNKLFAFGGSECFDVPVTTGVVYWTSTQIEEAAYVQSMNDGGQSGYGKIFENHVRAVRLVPYEVLCF